MKEQCRREEALRGQTNTRSADRYKGNRRNPQGVKVTLRKHTSAIDGLQTVCRLQKNMNEYIGKLWILDIYI